MLVVFRTICHKHVIHANKSKNWNDVHCTLKFNIRKKHKKCVMLFIFIVKVVICDVTLLYVDCRK